MSVQVKRRREAAAFLAGYVGAQGELLVDTTNNRVQVHDGATAGGWAAASIGDLAGRNAAINGTFAINQRVYASGTALSANAYGHDRWKAGVGGCTYNFTQTVPDTLVTITAGTLVQAIDAPNVYATSFWLTWIGTASVRVWQGTAAGAYSAGTTTKAGGVTVNALLVMGLGLGAITAIEFSIGTLGLVQFEAALPNAGPTRFERRLISPEQNLCNRYYQRITFIPGATIIDVYCGGPQSIPAMLPIQTMRATPTISFAGLSFNNGASIGTYGTPNCIMMIGGSSSAGRVYLSAAGGGAYIELNAEI